MLDHAKLVANYREALKNPAVAHPNYRRLDLQRQTLQPDGPGPSGRTFRRDENLKVLDNLPEVDEELTPDNVRPTNLVDPLPFLKAGSGRRFTSPASFPRKRKRSPRPAIGAAA